MKLPNIYKQIIESAIPPDLPAQNVGAWQSTQTPVENPNPRPVNVNPPGQISPDAPQLEGADENDMPDLQDIHEYKPIGEDENGRQLFHVRGKVYEYVLEYDPATGTWRIRAKRALVANPETGAGGLSQYDETMGPKEGHGMFYNPSTGKWELYANPNDPNDRIYPYLRIRGVLHRFDRETGDYEPMEDLEWFRGRQREGEAPPDSEIPSHEWNPLVWGPYGYPRDSRWHRERRLNPYHFKDNYSRYSHEDDIYNPREERPPISDSERQRALERWLRQNY
jgi:hypothetical protein